jgi:hypothetical protein
VQRRYVLRGAVGGIEESLDTRCGITSRTDSRGGVIMAMCRP